MTFSIISYKPIHFTIHLHNIAETLHCLPRSMSVKPISLPFKKKLLFRAFLEKIELGNFVGLCNKGFHNNSMISVHCIRNGNMYISKLVNISTLPLSLFSLPNLYSYVNWVKRTVETGIQTKIHCIEYNKFAQRGNCEYWMRLLASIGNKQILMDLPSYFYKVAKTWILTHFSVFSILLSNDSLMLCYSHCSFLQV